MSGRYSWYLQHLQHLRYKGKHKKIVIFTMFWGYSWYLRRLKYDEKHKNIAILAMLWRYSWYLQRLKYNGKHQNIVVFAMSWRYSWYLQRLKYNGKHTHIVPNTSKKQENTLIVNHALGSVGYVMHLNAIRPPTSTFANPLVRFKSLHLFYRCESGPIAQLIRYRSSTSRWMQRDRNIIRNLDQGLLTRPAI